MYYKQSCAAKGKQYGNSERPLFIRSMQRAPVNVHRTASSFEMLVFAPGRIKEQFSISVEGKELRIAYTPPEGFPRPEWIQREYSRGGFIRSFVLDAAIDAQQISAKYEDGVLYLHLPFASDAQQPAHKIVIG